MKQGVVLDLRGRTRRTEGDAVEFRFLRGGKLVVCLADGSWRSATEREAMRLLGDDSGIALGVALANLDTEWVDERLPRAA